MTDLSLYFDPFDPAIIENVNPNFSHELWLNKVTFVEENTPLDLSTVQLAIFGVPESRNSYQNNGTFLAPDEIRKELYRLYACENEITIVDFGNLKLGNTIEDTYHIVSEITSCLIENNVVSIVLGGSNDIAYPIYRAYELLEKVTNMVSVDATFDLGSDEMPISSIAYLDKIVMQQPNYLLNYAHLGYQTYLNSQESLQIMDELFFETYRVGELRQNMLETEALVRNADILSLDISAIRRSDAPGNPFASANGFYGEEICQIAKYAGISDKLMVMGVYEYNPTFDYHQQTAQVIAQMLWYFIDAVTRRVQDTRFENRQNYVRYAVETSKTIDDLIFYKSKKTGRWWVELPVYQKNNKEHIYYLPCTESDYTLACKDIVSQRWWKNLNKLNR